jgi:hypothetical protein
VLSNINKVIKIIFLALVISTPYILAKTIIGIILILLEEIVALIMFPVIFVNLQIKYLLILIAN